MAENDEPKQAEEPKAEAAPALPTVRSGKIALRYIGKGAHTFGPDGFPLPARHLPAAEVKAVVRTQRNLKAVLDTGLYEIDPDAADAEDLPDDEAPRRRGG